jgi:hypothetical protein
LLHFFLSREKSGKDAQAGLFENRSYNQRLPFDKLRVNWHSLTSKRHHR